jgi:hypothetical protein
MYVVGKIVTGGNQSTGRKKHVPMPNCRAKTPHGLRLVALRFVDVFRLFKRERNVQNERMVWLRILTFPLQQQE